MFRFKVLEEEEFKDEDKKEPIICQGCKKVIKKDYFYDRITQNVYCSRECYLSQIEKEYFD